MKLKSEVSTEEVDEAHYLFELSTMKSIEGKEFGYTVSENVGDELQKIEDAIRKRVCIGNQVYTAKLIDEMQEKYSESNVLYALTNMVKNGEFREIKGKKQLIR